MAWGMMGPMIGMNAQMPEPTLGQKLKYGLSQFFSPENANANMGLASALLSQSGYAPEGQQPTLGQALGQSLGGYQRGQALDKQNAEEDQLKALAKQMGFEGLPPSVMPGLVSKMLESQYGAAPSELRTFEAMTDGMSGADREKARRIALGLDPRTTSGFLNLGDRFIHPVTGEVFSAGLKPGDQPAVKGEQAAAEAAAKTGGVVLSTAQEQVDKEFGKEYADWAARGGYADVQKQAGQLRGVLAELGAAPGYTGPVAGRTPDVVRGLSEGGQKAIAARDAVEEVVQRNLRLILGAQFTEEEGKRLIARAYNPTLPDAENAKRVGRLLDQIEAAAAAKQSAAQYYEQNGTLKGWRGALPRISDFEEPAAGGFKVRRKIK